MILLLSRVKDDRNYEKNSLCEKIKEREIPEVFFITTEWHHLSQARALKLYTRQLQTRALTVITSLHVISTLFCSNNIIWGA